MPTIENIYEWAKDPEIIAVLLTTVVAVAQYFLRPKARTVWADSHQFTFLLPPQNNMNSILLNTRTVFISNIGRASAENIEIYFNYKPEHFEIYPTCNYNYIENPDGHFCIIIPNLGPKENFSIELLQTGRESPSLLRVRTPAQGECRMVFMRHQQVYSNKVNYSILTLLILGLYTAIELVIRLFI